MRAEQLSIFLENKSGRLSEVTKTLGDAGVNIRALSIADTSDFGILRIIVDDNDKAVTVLKSNDFTVSKTNVVAVEVEDKPGGLARILAILDRENINVEYMYAFLDKQSNNAINIIKFDDNGKAISVLTANNIKIIEGEKLYNL